MTKSLTPEELAIRRKVLEWIRNEVQDRREGFYCQMEACDYDDFIRTEFAMMAMQDLEEFITAELTRLGGIKQ